MTEETYSAGVCASPCLDKYSATEDYAIVNFQKENEEGITKSTYLRGA